jgi:hypothetical protein
MRKRTFRSFLQWVTVSAGWAAFGWSWVRVAGETPASTMIWSIAAIAIIAIVIVSTTLGWIAHNLRIYRRKGPRRAVPQVQREFKRDFLGRELNADWLALYDAALIAVVVVEDRKSFEPVGTETVREPALT